MSYFDDKSRKEVRSYHNTVYVLSMRAHPCVTVHDDCISLHHQEYVDGSDGFSIQFKPCHLEVVEKLAEALRRMKAGVEEEAKA